MPLRIVTLFVSDASELRRRIIERDDGWKDAEAAVAWNQRVIDRACVGHERKIDVTGKSETRAEMFERSNGGYTVPQIFIGAFHVGGSDQLHALDRAAKLDSLLAVEGIITAGPSA